MANLRKLSKILAAAVCVVALLVVSNGTSFAGIRYVYVVIKPPKVHKTKLMHFPSGMYSLNEADLLMAARSIPMVWERNYRSNSVIKDAQNGWRFTEPADGPLGFGWGNGWLARIDGDAYINGHGKVIYFKMDQNGNYLTNMDEGLSLKKTAAGYELVEVGRYTYTFNGKGKLSSVRDRRGNTATLTYDAAGNLIVISDATGRQAFTFTYNAANKITSVTDLAGRTVSYEYDAFGNLVKVSRGSAVTASYTYNGNHGVTSKANALGETYTIEYYANLLDKGIVKRILDPLGTEHLKRGEPTAGHETSFTYDFDGKVFYNTDYNGSTFMKVLNGNGQIVAVDEIKDGKHIPVSKILYDGRTTKTTDALGNTTIVQSDEWGNIIKRTDGAGGEKKSTYTADNKLLTATDQLGTVTRNEYDTVGNLTKTTWAVGKAEETSTTYSYDSFGEAVAETTDDATKTAVYNSLGLPGTITDAAGNTVTYTYDSAGSVTSYTDASGNKTEYSYDDRGNLVTKKDPEGNTTSYTYNAANRLVSVKDPLNHVTIYETSYKGKTTATIDPLGNRTEYAYDGNGNLTTITRGDSVISMTYDSTNRMTTFTDPEGNTTTYEYGGGCTGCSASIEKPAKITDPLGNVTENSFDRAGRLIGIQDPLFNVTAFVRDAAGMVTSRIDANNNATQYQDDALKRPVKQIDANGGEIALTYDNRGKVTALTDPNSNTTTFEYDLAGRVTKEIRPMGQATEYTHYPNGLLKTAKDAKGQVTNYTYDKASRLTEVAYADGKKDSFSYDAAGNMTGYANESVTGSITYDELNRKTSETVNYGTFSKTYSYTYDAKGNKASFTSPEGKIFGYGYNKKNQLKTIAFDGKSIAFDYQWKRLVKATYPNGVTADYQYNENSWLTGISSHTAISSIKSSSHTFDNVGNITGKTTDQGALTYTYDVIYQLTGATSSTGNEAFTYDKTGNRLTTAAAQTTWTYNRNNELLTTDAAAFTYDSNGNTITKTESGLTTTYNYNSRNRLESVQLPDGRTAVYTYDPFGRRIKKQTPIETTYYLYANEGLIGEYDASGYSKKAYAWRPNGIWGTNPLLMQENNSTYFYHNDHLGTPQKMTEMTGGTVWSAGYTVFGEATVDPISTVTNNLRVPGQYFDEGTGLHYNWNRYYDPGTGRYTQVDPIGFRGGDVDLFRYALNNPINKVDPIGLYEVCPNLTVSFNQEWNYFYNKLRETAYNIGSAATIALGTLTTLITENPKTGYATYETSQFMLDLSYGQNTDPPKLPTLLQGGLVNPPDAH